MMKFCFIFSPSRVFLFHIYICVVSTDKRVLMCGDVGGNAILVCNLTEKSQMLNIWFRDSDGGGASRTDYIDNGTINPKLEDRYKIIQNNKTEHLDLQVSNLTLKDEGIYTCENSNSNNVLVRYIVNLKIIGDDCSGYTECQSKTDFHASRCEYLQTTIDKDMSYITEKTQTTDTLRDSGYRSCSSNFIDTAIPIWYIVLPAALSGVFFIVIIILLYTVIKLKRCSRTVSYTHLMPFNNISTERTGDAHVYNEINEIEMATNTGEREQTSHTLNYGSDNDDTDYLHPYNSLLPNRQIEHQQYERLMNVNLQRKDHSNIDLNKSVNPFPKGREIKDVLYKSVHNVQRSKYLFYSEPCNLNECFFHIQNVKMKVKPEEN